MRIGHVKANSPVQNCCFLWVRALGQCLIPLGPFQWPLLRQRCLYTCIYTYIHGNFLGPEEFKALPALCLPGELATAKF